MTGNGAIGSGRLEFMLDGNGTVAADVSRVTIGGWTGRDQQAVARYVDGLVQKGFARPSSLPCYYGVSPSLLTQVGTIDVLGETTSGEAEVLIITAGGDVYVGLGSDHTDRAMAPKSVAYAKQLCAKPVARAVWRLADVAGHWDELVLTATIEEIGRDAVVYQQGRLSELLPLADLLAVATAKGDPEKAGVLFCGTVPAIGGIRPSGSFAMRLEDPRSGRHIAHSYTINAIPMVN